MSKKVSDMEEKDQTSLQNDIRRAASPLMEDEWSTDASERPKSLEAYGLCSTCNAISFVASEFRVRLVACDTHQSSVHGDFILHTSDPIKECTHYNERGRLSLNDMASMAILIDPNPKPPVGFKGKKKKPNHQERDV